ncbi:alpha/beta hydrolase [Caballeronia calidae]|nr:alpha/beta fold hydrolase [Caballeronia calidae]
MSTENELHSTNAAPALLTVREQGSFAVGGTVIRCAGTYDPTGASEGGQTLHGDHANVSYQVPVEARRYPLVFLHGNQQCSRTWQTTPDGREGFQNIFLRRGFACYLIDQPRRGSAGRSTQPMTLLPRADDQTWFDNFRIGMWPDYFPNVQFSRDPTALDQLFRQITPDTGPFDVNVIVPAIEALFDKIGPGILVTHSKGGGVGWLSAIRHRNIRAIVSYEPGSNFPFLRDEVPPAMECAAGPLTALGVSGEEFERLTEIPIAIFYGDFIPEEPTANRGQDQWRVRLAMARRWAEAVNRHGGDACVVRLPDIGLKGNTHFPFSDFNNIEVANELSKFLASKGLD